MSEAERKELNWILAEQKKAPMTPNEIHADIVGEFKRMGFAQHGSGDVPSGLKASVAVLEKGEAK